MVIFNSIPQLIKHHMWRSADDPAVRASHAELDGKVAEVGQLFGYGLKFPGDPQAAIGQIANCRCTTAPFFPEDEDE